MKLPAASTPPNTMKVLLHEYSTHNSKQRAQVDDSLSLVVLQSLAETSALILSASMSRTVTQQHPAPAATHSVLGLLSKPVLRYTNAITVHTYTCLMFNTHPSAPVIKLH